MNATGWWKRHWYSLHYYSALFFFAVGVGLLQVLSLLGILWTPGPRLQGVARHCVWGYLRLYFLYLETVGALKTRFPGWREDFARTPGIIVANHPSMLDAPLLLSRLRRGVCIFKAALGRNVMRGRAASVTGYMHSEEGVDGLRAVIESVRRGAQFVFFPEGTRTPGTGAIGPLRPLYAVVAKYARVPVHIFAIERNTNALCKDQDLRRPPILPARFEIRHVETVSPDAAPTAALLHARVERTLRPLIEAHRRPLRPEWYAACEPVEASAERLEWRFQVPAGEGFFAGHFPGHPIAPGAASVHWILKAWQAGPGAGRPPPQLQRVRFQREIRPGAELRLEIARRGSTWRAVLETSEGPVTTATVVPAVDS